MLDDKLRVGIYGGTFAPVHNGHVESAAAFMKQMKVSPSDYRRAYRKQEKELD